MARPSIYSEETAAIICELIRLGKTLKEIEAVKGMPSETTIISWASRNLEFQAQYAQAREDSGDVWADESALIIRRVSAGEMDPGAARVALDGIKWLAGKRKPKVYGDRTVVAGDADAPIAISGKLEIVLVKPETIE